jgi:hypothetical protein
MEWVCMDVRIFPKFSTPKLLQLKIQITGPFDFADIAALNGFCRYQVMHSLYWALNGTSN